VALTDFKLFNQSVSAGSEFLPQVIDRTTRITLPYNQSVIAFTFAGLSYQLSQKNMYQYQLAGFDEDWSPPSSKREATYTNLDPGNYTFMVRAANNDGLWNDTPLTLELTILPPWWQTWWFRLGMVLAAAGLIAAVYSWRTYTIRERNRHLEAEVAQRTRDLQIANAETAQALVEAKAANQAKSAFLANMSHDLRTPLNGILGYAQIMDWDDNLTETQRHGLSVIRRSGDHLLNLINDGFVSRGGRARGTASHRFQPVNLHHRSGGPAETSRPAKGAVLPAGNPPPGCK
jgi:signal transduction histidine kinase